MKLYTRLRFWLITLAGMLAVMALGGIAVPSVPAHAAGPWYVAPGGSDANDCVSPVTPCATINGAIGKAASGDTIEVAVGTYIGTGTEVVLIDKSVTLSGGWDATFTTQSGMSTIDGQKTRRGITVASGVTMTVEHLLVQNGSYTSTPFYGGGISNNGTLIINNSAVSRNHATDGGGIYNNGILTMTNSAVTDNTAIYGGGINNTGGQVSLNNSTVSGNTGSWGGGGFYNQSSGTLSLNSTTISSNKADGGVYGTGGGINNWSGTVTLKNTVLASNSATNISPDCTGFISLGYNLVGSTSNCSFSLSTGDLTNLSAGLGPRVGNPAYHPLSSTSPAVNGGNPSGCVGSTGSLTADQRGAARAGVCDIGAYEYTPPGSLASIVAVGGTPQNTNPLTTFGVQLQAMVLDDIGSPAPGITVTFTAPGSGASGTFVDSGTETTTAITNEFGVATAASFTANAAVGGYSVAATASGIAAPANFQLINALWFVAPGGNDANDCLSFSTPCATLNGAIGKSSSGQTIRVAVGTYTGTGSEVALIDKSLTLSGGWNSTFTTQNGLSTADGQNTREVLHIVGSVNTLNVVIERFIAQNGIRGIDNNGQTVTLNNSVVNGNTSGSGIWTSGTMVVNNSIISGNTASDSGGGIYKYGGTLTLNNSIVRDNISSSYGGGIFNEGGALTLNASAVIGNIATGTNGGGGVFHCYGCTLTINNSTLSGNTAVNAGGGGILNTGTLLTNNTTISNNKAKIGGGLNMNSGSATLQNTILAANLADSAPDCSGTVGSSGYNLIGNTLGCTFTPGTGDKININPQLGLYPIGSPAYHALLGVSPAIDAGNPATCLATDQRGMTRPQGSTCDIGAYEYKTSGSATSFGISMGNNQKAAPLFAFASPLVVYVIDSSGSPVSGVTITFTAPGSGVSGTFANTGTNLATVSTNNSGVAIASTFTANSQLGNYNVIATASGLAGSVSFALSNAAWYVAPTGDDGNTCLAPATPCLTLNGAISKAVDGDTIKVATGAYTGSGTEVVLINKSVRLSGGWNASFSTQSGMSTLNAQSSRRGVTMDSGPVVIERFTIQNGSASDGGGILINNGSTLTLNDSLVSNNTVTSQGAGILNAGNLTINNSLVSANSASAPNGIGAGIWNAGTLVLNRSTVSHNTAGWYSGGIFNRGTATVNQSSISHNTGAGITNDGSSGNMGILDINNSTVSNNSSTGIFNYFSNDSLHSVVTTNNSTISHNASGGIGNSANISNVKLQNTILAQNTTSGVGPNCNSITSLGYNIIGDISGCTFNTSTGDLLNVDPKLGPLTGSPAYHPLLPGSPAINAGNPAGCVGSAGPLTTDQRGAPRFGRCDIGAYEDETSFADIQAIGTFAPGNSVTYKISLHNTTGTAIAGLVVTDTLPTPLTYEAASLTATSGTYSAVSGVITWNGTLPAGGSVTITFRAMGVPSCSFVTNAAQVGGSGFGFEIQVTNVTACACGLSKNGGNPVLSVGAGGAWDSASVWSPVVILDGSTYKMWYTGSNGATSRIGYATSSDGVTWTKSGSNPVLTPSLSWEGSQVYGPSIILDGGVYKMWYTGRDGSGVSRLGYATSPDGIAWTKAGSSAVLDVGTGGGWEDAAVTDPTVIKAGSLYHLWYTGTDGVTPRLGHATSSDGLTWSKDSANPVLDLGAPGSWDWIQVYGPSVVAYGENYLLWYSGGTLPAAYQSGYAISSDGSNWTRVDKLIPQGSPSAFDAKSADFPSVMVDGGGFKIWYSGLNAAGRYTIGYATASTGVCVTSPSLYTLYLPLVVKSGAGNSCPAYYTDSFTDPASGWPVSDNASRKFAYTGGEYQILVKNAFQGWAVTPGAKATDFTASVTARRTSGSLGAYGIEFGINEDWSQLYEVLIDAQSFSVWRYDSGWTPLVNWTYSGAIHTGGISNRLKVIRSGASIAVYVNNQSLVTVNDSSFTGLRRIALVAESDDTALDARFDDFSLYPAACGVGALNAPEAIFEMGLPEAHAVPRPPGLSQP